MRRIAATAAAMAALAGAGECALVMLLADEEPTLRRAASAMGGS